VGTVLELGGDHIGTGWGCLLIVLEPEVDSIGTGLCCRSCVVRFINTSIDELGSEVDKNHYHKGEVYVQFLRRR
jgi:hypothetical protein